VKVPKFMRGNHFDRDDDGKILYDEVLSSESTPNMDVLHSKGISINSHPADWFNVFMLIHSKRQAHPDEVSIADLTSWTNKKLLLMNAGSGGSIYPNCVQFSVDKVKKHLGLYIFHGIVPSPQVEMKFQSTKNNKEWE